MKTNVRFAAGLALFAFGAPFPACGQFIYPPIIIIPPPENYATSEPAPKPPPAKPKPAAKPGGYPT